MNKSIVRVTLLLALALVLGLFAFGGPAQDIGASPLDQQAMRSVWFDQTIPTTGVTAIIDSGTANTWAVFLHIDAPGAADSYTMTIGGRAVIGTSIYTETLDLYTTSAHDFTVAQNKVISATYASAEMWPQHFVTVNSRNASLTGDLLWLQAR